MRPSNRRKEQTLETGDVRMHYITFGKGERPLVMIQGLSTRSIKGTGLILENYYRMFSSRYKVYIFDRRENIPEGITVRELAHDVCAAMDHLGIKNADIFAASQGGMIAQYLAIDRPDLVRKMVLAVTLSRNNDTVKAVIDGWIDMVQRRDIKAMLADMTEKMYSASYLKRNRLFIPLANLMQIPTDIPRFVALAKSCLTCDTYDMLDRIQCPVLVIGGKQDKIVSGEASEEIAEKLGCSLYMYEELGHAAYTEAKDFNRRVFDLLQE